MNFEDKVLEKVELADALSVARMVTEHLCGKRHYAEVANVDVKLLKSFLDKVKDSRLAYEQFNELLLLLKQATVSKGFFDFFFNVPKISLEQLREGIVRFKGFAMLAFGNFRYAFKTLMALSIEDIRHRLASYCGEHEASKGRPQKTIEIAEIPRDNTWYTGFISKAKLAKEGLYAERLVKSKQDESVRRELTKELAITYGEKGGEFYTKHLALAERYAERYSQIEEDVLEAQSNALANTDTYLIWDYMDVYVATSMRHSWEFEDTFDFIRQVFINERFEDGTENPLVPLNLRYFDPTQSLSDNRIDKGLVEGLMLKRVYCTIYMAQESDTLGKDSELASTLAQRKPVIAYVPKIDDVEHYSTQIVKRPLDFFEKRFLILWAEGLLDDRELANRLYGAFQDWEEIMDDFIDALNRHRLKQPFTLIVEEETRFKERFSRFADLCKLLAIMEAYNFDKRARTLQETHPLAIQVDLQSGVANGVLVVRNAKDCALLIQSILKKSLQFTIKHAKVFDLREQDYESLMSAKPQLTDKLSYDRGKRTLYVDKDLSSEELSDLSEFSKEAACPEALRIPFQRFDQQGLHILEERVSGSPFRVVTNDEKLTNSFWNFYLTF